MLRSLRSALARFAVRRAAACQRDAPKRAELWLRLGCAVAPTFAESHPALVRLRRAIEDRWGAVAAAQEAAQRFPANPDAWMLLGEAWQMVFRQQDALVAYEQVLTLEERPDAALAAGAVYRPAGRRAPARLRSARERQRVALGHESHIQQRERRQRKEPRGQHTVRQRRRARLQDDGLGMQRAEQKDAQVDEGHQAHPADAQHGGVAGPEPLITHARAHEQIPHVAGAAG